MKKKKGKGKNLVNVSCRVTQGPYITGARMALKEVKGLSGTQVADTTFYLRHTTNPQSVRNVSDLCIYLLSVLYSAATVFES